MFLCEEGRKKFTFKLSKDNTISRDALSDLNLTETTKNHNKSVISVIQFNTKLWSPTEYAVSVKPFRE